MRLERKELNFKTKHRFHFFGGLKRSMKRYFEIEFCTLKVIEYRILEIIVNEGINLDLEKVNVLHETFERELEEPYGILVNTINNFSYSLEAINHIANHPYVYCVARLNYSETAELTSSYVKKTVKETMGNTFSIENFQNRLGALEWLRKNITSDE